MATREPGFYWVKYRHDGGRWTVAEWTAGGPELLGSAWSLIDSEEGCHEDDLVEIGPRLTPPPDMQVVDVEKWITLPGWVLVKPKAP